MIVVGVMVCLVKKKAKAGWKAEVRLFVMCDGTAQTTRGGGGMCTQDSEIGYSPLCHTSKKNIRYGLAMYTFAAAMVDRPIGEIYLGGEISG